MRISDKDVQINRAINILESLRGTSVEPKGETFVGLTLHENKPIRLFLLEGEFEGTWQEAIDEAQCRGGVLPSRIDMLVLLERARGSFKQAAYWTSEPYADAESYAWCQYFDFGGQYYYRKYGKLRARAVRRLPL